MASTLKAHRLRLGLTQIQLARMAGVTERTIRLYEQGQRTPRLGTARAIADALGVSVEELFPPGDTAG
jgi:transcriptional regulator with XRE-family HTH domain